MAAKDTVTAHGDRQRVEEKRGEDGGPPATQPFAFEAFRRGGFAVHCDTEDKARQFLKYLHGKGLKWCSGNPATALTMYSVYEADTCYYNEENAGISFCRRSYFASKGVQIVSFHTSEPD